MTLDFLFYLSFSYYTDQIKWMQDVFVKAKEKLESQVRTLITFLELLWKCDLMKFYHK